MRWLIIQSDGAHKGQDDWEPNWFLRECYGIQRALISHGMHADIWGLRHGCYLGPKPNFESYEVVLFIENYEFDWLPDFNWSHPLKIQWIIDLHVQPNAYQFLSNRIDVVLHSTESLIADYSSQVPRPKHIWFPNAVDDYYFNLAAPAPVRDIDLIFIGGKNGPPSGRKDTVERMERDAGLRYEYQVSGFSYIGRLKRAKIGFNRSINVDLNYRAFETIALGACLLTDYNPMLEKLGFVHGKNCLVYHTDDEAVQLAKECLSTGTWKQIGEAGVELSKKHTYRERIKELLKKL